MILTDTLTVDTGLTTAWAHWTGTAFPKVGQCVCSSVLPPIERFKFMLARFDAVLASLQPKKVILEMVELWEGSVKSHMATVRGDTFTLALLIGGYMTKIVERDISVELLSAREWKGQLTKEATAFRVKMINGMIYMTDHITDAVAMGFSRDIDIWNLKKGAFTK
jgi:hypothetical protein